MAFKVHIIYTTFRAVFKFLNERKDDSTKTDKEKLHAYAKNLLATKDENFPKVLELFCRQAIKEFPFRQSVLLQQMVATLSKTKVVSDFFKSIADNEKPLTYKIFREPIRQRSVVFIKF